MNSQDNLGLRDHASHNTQTTQSHVHAHRHEWGPRVVRRRRLRRTPSGAASVERATLRARRRTSFRVRAHVGNACQQARAKLPARVAADLPIASCSRRCADDTPLDHGGLAQVLCSQIRGRLPRPTISRSSTIRHVEGGFEVASAGGKPECVCTSTRAKPARPRRRPHGFDARRVDAPHL